MDPQRRALLTEASKRAMERVVADHAELFLKYQREEYVARGLWVENEDRTVTLVGPGLGSAQEES